MKSIMCEAIPVRRTQRSRSKATRAALIQAARTLFGQHGYASANINDVVAAASVTRGALYHHFADKERLFEAVAIAIALEISDEARAAVRPMHSTTWERFLSGLSKYLELVANRTDAQRILLVDGPAVLGWERWRRMQFEVVLPATVVAIDKLMKVGRLRPGEPVILAHLILAALNDAAMAIANAPDAKRARQPITDALMQLVEGLAVREKGHHPGGRSAATG
jgi:AcrR family transcriptional regulator